MWAPFSIALIKWRWESVGELRVDGYVFKFLWFRWAVVSFFIEYLRDSSSQEAVGWRRERRNGRDWHEWWNADGRGFSRHLAAGFRQGFAAAGVRILSRADWWRLNDEVEKERMSEINNSGGVGGKGGGGGGGGKGGSAKKWRPLFVSYLVIFLLLLCLFVGRLVVGYWLLENKGGHDLFMAIRFTLGRRTVTT